MRRLAFLIVTLWTTGAWAFPEMIRYGYTQCTACHVSPSGGGILNKYGRELSAELLSTWSYENESQFTHSHLGKDLSEKGVLVGGDVRAISIHSDSTGDSEDKKFVMMGNLQGAYDTEHFTGVVSVGEITKPEKQGSVNGDLNSTEYYGYAKFNDEFGVRAGRFVPAFGIGFPDHTLAIKEMLGMTLPTFQFDTVEASYLSENWTVLASVARTTLETRIKSQEYAKSLNVSYAFMNSMRVGVSWWDGSGPQIDRRILGVNAILGFTKKFYAMEELDFQHSHDEMGQFGLSQLAYEVCKGVTPYLQYQYEQDNQDDPTTLVKTYGVGTHFYPRPHWEISAEWDRVNDASAGWSNQGYAMAHYYF